MARRAEEDARSGKASLSSGAGLQPKPASRRDGLRLGRPEQEHPVKASLSTRATMRPKTLSRREMQREKRRREKAGERLEIIPYQRPSTRSECVQGPRPCLYVACKYHLYLDVNPETGSVKINFPGIEPWEMAETCALDVAEKGGITLEDVGEILNLTRERVRQVEMDGLTKMQQLSEDYELDAFMGWESDQSKTG